MKKMVIGAVAALAFAGVAFAQEVTVAFENELSSDVVSISDGSAEFAGFANQVTVGNHELSAGVAVEIADSVGFSFPVSYKYSF